MNNNDLMGMLMNTLSNPDSKDKIMEIMSSLGSQQKNESEPERELSPAPPSLPAYNSNTSNDFLNVEMISKIKSMLDNFNRTDDSRISLLTSIKPYMKSSRVKNIDMAIKFIQFINFASGFKDN